MVANKEATPISKDQYGLSAAQVEFMREHGIWKPEAQEEKSEQPKQAKSEQAKLIAMASGKAVTRRQKPKASPEKPGAQGDFPELARGKEYHKRALLYIQENEGVFARDRTGSYHVLVNGKRVPLNFDVNNDALSRLLSVSCDGASIWDKGIKPCISQLRVDAVESSSNFLIKNFSALSLDQQRLYVPLKNLKLLQVSKSGICIVENGKNDDSFWVEPARLPDGVGDLFSYTPTSNLQGFERFLVNTQGCAIPELRWLVAMGEGLYPFIKDTAQSRFIFMHHGKSTHGKTSGAQRFSYLLGLDEVFGDVSVATLNDLGDFGLLVMDNLEQHSLTQEYINYFLILSTGGRTGRAFADGTTRGMRDRPVAVITSIEGGFKQEFNNRCIDVEYAISGLRAARGCEVEILQMREALLSSMMPVLQRYFCIRGREPSPVLKDNTYQEHFGALCDLLRAYGEIAGKPRGWSQHIINVWASVLGKQENNVDELEEQILQAIESVQEGLSIFGQFRLEYRGQGGTLYTIQCRHLLENLRRLSGRDNTLPKNSSGLGKRLNSTTFRTLKFLSEEDGLEVPQLKRTGEKRAIGFFIADDDMDAVIRK